MQDRPTVDELLAAIERWLDEQVVARGEGALRYQGRVAANAIRVIRRELELEDEQLGREWTGLDGLLGVEPRPEGRALLREALRARNERLCAMIRSGAFDTGDERARALDHVRQAVRDKLLVTNPGWVGGDTKPDARRYS